MICLGCKWHDEYTWVCSNGDSPYRADFVNDGCEFYEEEIDEDIGRCSRNKIQD